MTRTVEVFRQTLVAKAEMDRAAAKEAEAEARRAQGLDALTRAFEARAAALMEGVSAPATEMQATAEAVARTARRPSPATSPTSRRAPRRRVRRPCRFSAPRSTCHAGPISSPPRLTGSSTGPGLPEGPSAKQKPARLSRTGLNETGRSLRPAERIGRLTRRRAPRPGCPSPCSGRCARRCGPTYRAGRAGSTAWHGAPCRGGPP